MLLQTYFWVILSNCCTLVSLGQGLETQLKYLFLESTVACLLSMVKLIWSILLCKSKVFMKVLLAMIVRVDIAFTPSSLPRVKNYSKMSGKDGQKIFIFDELSLWGWGLVFLGDA